MLRKTTNPRPRLAWAVLAALALASPTAADVGEIVTPADDTTIGEVEARLESMNDVGDSLIEGTDGLIDISVEEEESATNFTRLANQILDAQVHRSLLSCASGCVNPRLMVPADHGGHLDRVMGLVDRSLDNAEHGSIETAASRALLAQAQEAFMLEANEEAFGLACAAFHAVGAE